MIWFSSDLHFNDPRVINSTGRPFKDLTEMNTTLVNNWNSVVDKEDTVYILGDFGDFTYTNYLNGKLILIKGNREDFIPDYELEQHFDFVYKFPVVHILEEGFQIGMAHKPAYLPLNELTEKDIQLFGHVHRTSLYRPYGMNIGTDVHYYTPIDLDSVIQRCEFIRTYYDQGIFK